MGKLLFVLVPVLVLAARGHADTVGAAPKVAVHIEEYTERTCGENLPAITREDIVTTYPGVGRINAFIVVYDYDEVQGIAFGLAWPEVWRDPMWQDCGAVRIGAIHRPGDHTNVMFEECSRGGAPVIVGWLSVTVTAPGAIEVIPSEGEGAVAVVDCNLTSATVSEVMFTADGGAGGAPGTDVSRFSHMKNRTWHVTPDSTGDAVSITAAVRRAIPGDTVAVAGGEYKETVYLRNGVAIVGSYNPDFTARDLMTFPSTITTEGAGTCVLGALAEDSTCVLDGFVITGGEDNFGGGIALRSGSSPTLKNLIVYGNHAKRGGGIFCHACSPVIEDVLIVANTASAGGGMACTMGASPRVARATIAANVADEGAGIWANGASPYIERSILAHHAKGSGIHCTPGSARVTFACVDLWGNVPSDFSGTAGPEMGLRDNIYEDPVFADVEGLDFTLSEDSPCRDLAGCGVLGATWTRLPRGMAPAAGSE